MNYICDTGDEKLDAMLRVLLEQLRDTSAKESKELLLVTEESQNIMPDDRYTAVIVLYTDDRYTYSQEHRELAARYGEKYRAVLRPLDLAEFLRLLRELHGESEMLVPPVPEEDERVDYDRRSRTVSFRGRTVKLTAREDELFRLMYEHRGKVVSRERIAASVWGSGTSTNVTDVYMSYLRRKLVSVLGDGVLSSVRGEGYILKMPAGGDEIGTR
jgi:hypothetical protein